MIDIRKIFPYLVVITGISLTAFSLSVLSSPCLDLGCLIQPVAWLGLVIGIDMTLALGLHRLSHLPLPPILHFVIRILYLISLALLITIGLLIAMAILAGILNL